MFDPYHKWLGIPPGRRPPTHYQLLGISPNETDLEVIEEAFIRQTSHLRTYQSGAYAMECTKLLNELAHAHVALTDPAKRQEYDAELEEERNYVARANIKPFNAPITQEPTAASEASPPKASRPRRHHRPAFRPKQRVPVAPIVIGVVLLLAVVVIAVIVWGGKGDKPETQLADRGSGARPESPPSRGPEASRPTPSPAPRSDPRTDSKPPDTPPEREDPPKPPVTKPPEEDSKPSDPPKSPPTKPDGERAAKKDDESPKDLSKVDLLKLINPLKQRHIVQDRWQFTGKVLASPLDANARIQLPYTPPEEYDLRVVAERRQGTDTAVIGLVLPTGRTFINFDSGPSVGYYSGLQGIDGRSLLDRAEGKVTGPVLVRGKNHIVCRVRKQSLVVMVNDRALLQYTGEFSRLACGDDWEGPIPHVFILGSWKTSYHFSAVELTPLGEQGKIVE